MTALRLGRQPLRALLPRLGQQLLGLRPGAVHEHAGLLLGLPDGHVGGPLREHERTADGVVVVVGCPIRDRPLGALSPIGELAHLLLQLLHRDGDLLQELVDFVGVVTAKAVTKLNLSQDFGGKIHVRMVYGAPRKWGGYRPSPARASG